MDEISEKDYNKLIEDTDKVLNELSGRLSNVSVKISKNSAEILQAITLIFGEQHIKSDGSSEITFEMFKSLTKSLREVGELKVQEYV